MKGAAVMLWVACVLVWAAACVALLLTTCQRRAPAIRRAGRQGRIIMRNVATVVFVFVVFVAIGTAAQTLRSPVNSGAAGCLRLANNPELSPPYFQTDILEPAGADRVRARFLVSNRCRVAVRVMGGLRMDGSEIEQRGPIDVLALQDAPGDRGGTAPVAGRASMPSFVVPANGRMEVDALIMLAGAVTPSEVAVAVAPSLAAAWGFTAGPIQGAGVGM